VVARRAKKIAGPYDLIAVDGNSLAYRAYFALPTTITGRDATPTNAIYGFLSMLIRALSELRPKGLVVAFDSAWPAFRHETFPEYKSGRLKPKDELLNQMPGLRSLLSDLGIQCCSEDGIEADDFLASYAERGMRAHLRTLIISGDNEFYSPALIHFLRQLYDDALRKPIKSNRRKPEARIEGIPK
jgi:DNA polymerase I